MKTRSPSKVTPCYLNEDKLKIIIRMRPILNEQDDSTFVDLEDDNTLQIKRPGNFSFMKFNNILPPSSTQKDVFYLVEDSIRQFLNGINITIFAYGQTGAGKTYSMIGNYSPKDSQENLFNFLSSKERGILSRSLQMIMGSMQKKKPGNKVFVSFFEIYNEKIFDLYNNTLVPLDIRESKNGEISIPDLLNVPVTCMEDAIQYLMVGLKNRATGSTHGNAQSSRSHSIFQISLEQEDENGETMCSSLRIVDLAGSEKFKISPDLSPSEKQIRIQELTSINGSLSSLGHCISALIEKTRTHIPFRNSKLTRILSDSLLGQGKMRFIICISPSLTASAETFSTLQFANRAKKAIFQRAEIRTPNLSKKKTSQNEEILCLKRDLQNEKQARISLYNELQALKNSKTDGVMKQNAFLRKENERLKQQLKDLMVRKDNSHSRSPQSSSRMQDDYFKNFQENKQNSKVDFKDQMLKLPIFQNSNNDFILQVTDKESKRSRVETSTQRSNISVNRKKAEFEKKIKKFIESDSPKVNEFAKKAPYFQNSQMKWKNPSAKERPHKVSAYSPNNYQHSHGYPLDESGHFQASHAYNDYETEMDQQMSQENGNQEMEWIDNEDTQQLIERACEKMNLPDFKDLRCEMDRAKDELSRLRQKDDEISRKKVLL